MLAHERQLRILQVVRTQGSVGTGELIRMLGTPHPTVARDLAALAARGEVLRVRGGAVLPDRELVAHSMRAAAQPSAGSVPPSDGSVSTSAGSVSSSSRRANGPRLSVVGESRDRRTPHRLEPVDESASDVAGSAPAKDDDNSADAAAATALDTAAQEVELARQMLRLGRSSDAIAHALLSCSHALQATAAIHPQ